MKLIMLALVFLSASLSAAPGLWFEPARDGHGLSISQPTDGRHAVLWYLYTRDGAPTWVIAEPCPSFPCVTPLFAPTANWLGGGFELGDEIGSLEIRADGDNLRASFDLRGLSPEQCDTGIGGLLLYECVGTITFVRLAD